MSPEFFRTLVIMLITFTAIGLLGYLLPILFGKKGGKNQ